MVRRNAALIVSTLVAVTLAACESTPRIDASAAPRPDVRTVDDGANPTAVTRGSRVQTGIVSLGAVPYDDFTLPLLNPSGDRVATQVGIAPRWSTVLAEPDAPLPEATSIQIRSLEPGVGSRLMHTLPSGVMLGRAADAEGFLVEQPLPEGRRRIGRCDWSSGAIEWIVDDDFVNAHASLGPDGRLAWSRRPVDRDRFDLMVRDARGERVLPSEDGESWLMPEWSSDGGTIHAMRLRDGVLQAASIVALDAQAMRQSLRTLTLSNRGTAPLAYQALAPRFGAAMGAGAPDGAWLLFHPGEGRMAIWWPRDGRLRGLHHGSISAAMVDADRAVISLDDRVLSEHLADGSLSATLVEGAHVIRTVTDRQWPVVLLRVGDGSVALTGLLLLEERGVAGAGRPVSPAP